MKRQQDERRQSRVFTQSPSSDKGGLLKAGTFSLLLHIAFLVFFSLSLRSTIPKSSFSVYRVTLKPLLGDGLPKGGSGVRGSEGIPASQSVEQVKPTEKLGKAESKKAERPLTTKKQKSEERLTKDQVVEGLKRSSKKAEKLEKERYSSKSLQEALDEIRKKAALDTIQKRIARREELTQSASGVETGTRVGSGAGTGTGSGSGTGTGAGVGSGTGTGGSPDGSPWGSPFGGSALQSKLDEYYNLIWEKIKKEWTIPGGLPKGKSSLETVIVIVIEREGRVQRSWFEKKSGNALYDQSAMRAIKKADPLPSIPKEFSDNTFEIGIRFFPE
ncbi:MAG TPA: energy transducer TonB [Thermodesulfobacteriota bacterium]|jgi:TolA protein|nr:energy transducer TonB [Thermodesulfobacteriota bacterium]